MNWNTYCDRLFRCDLFSNIRHRHKIKKSPMKMIQRRSPSQDQDDVKEIFSPIDSLTPMTLHTFMKFQGYLVVFCMNNYKSTFPFNDIDRSSHATSGGFTYLRQFTCNLIAFFTCGIPFEPSFHRGLRLWPNDGGGRGSTVGKLLNVSINKRCHSASCKICFRDFLNQLENTFMGNTKLTRIVGKNVDDVLPGTINLHFFR